MSIHHPASNISKRIFDICISVPVVLFVFPILYLIVWVTQRFQSPGPVLYTQIRYGRNRETFSIIKFRTMHINSTPERSATKGDSRIYPFGSFLRRTSLDEIPQFINVLVGDMSVNGPRPFLCEHDRRYECMYPDYILRSLVKPGITGLAQSLGHRGEIKCADCLTKRIECDLLYIRNWSMLMEFRLVYATALQVLFPPKTAI